LLGKVYLLTAWKDLLYHLRCVDHCCLGLCGKQCIDVAVYWRPLCMLVGHSQAEKHNDRHTDWHRQMETTWCRTTEQFFEHPGSMLHYSIN